MSSPMPPPWPPSASSPIVSRPDRRRGRPPETAAHFRGHDRLARESGSGIQVLEALEQGDGVVHHSLVSKFPIPSPEGAGDFVSAMAIDITDRMAMEEKLRQADRRKNEFLATLAPIRTTLRLMKRPEGGGEFEAERAMAERQVVHLARLIDDLMDVARITRGKIELHRRAVDLATVVREAVETARPLIEERRHRLAVSLPEGPIHLDADPTRLEQVIWNLLNNAAKSTEPGGRIELRAGRVGGKVVVDVRDTGIGIDPAVLPRVLHIFVQVGGHEGRSQGGLGIGLCLVRTLVELHAGTIEARSKGPGAGSEFIVRLPVLEMVEAEAPQAKLTPEGPAARLRVLVVDDNHDAARSLARLLTRIHGQDVRVAHDGPDALRAADEFRPDLVLLNIGLPGMDGHAVAEVLRRKPEFARLRIVALTGWGQDDDRRRSREAGIDRHLDKSVDPDAIAELLAEGGPVD